MAKIRIKTDMADIKLADVKPDEFTGAWKWVLDVLETMNACKGDPVKAIEDEIDDIPFDAFNFKGHEVKSAARNAIIDTFLFMPTSFFDSKVEEIEKYSVLGGDGKAVFDKICDELIESDSYSYAPRSAASLTGSICGRFFLEQSKK